MLNLIEHGDILESQYYTEVVTSISTYETFWRQYVGNDGNAQIVESGNSNVDRTRRDLAQHSYTILESLVSIYRIKMQNLPIISLEDYLNENDRFILFQTQCGRIYDCVHKIGNILHLPTLEEHLVSFYKTRNQVLHGKKLPFTIIEGMFTLPRIMKDESENEKWHDKLLWNELNQGALEFVFDVYNELYNEMVKQLNAVYTKIISSLSGDKKFQKVSLILNNYERKPNEYIVASGISENHVMASIIVGEASGSANGM